VYTKKRYTIFRARDKDAVHATFSSSRGDRDPAAIENQNYRGNATSASKILCEGATATSGKPTHHRRKGILTVPDILGNAGGVRSAISSGAGTQGFFWRESAVNSALWMLRKMLR